MSEEFDEAYWEQRYHGRTVLHGGRPNPQLVAEAGELAPGTALDAGCGEGADSIWLASRGWRVTAVDFATTALRRGREHADTLGAEVAGRIDWVRADLGEWTPAGQFDLVSAQYVHPPAGRAALFHRLAEWVAPGGTLLIVGHHPPDPGTVSVHPTPRAHLSADEVVAGLDAERWDIVRAEARSRPASTHDGQEITFLDAVLRARKRP